MNRKLITIFCIFLFIASISSQATDINILLLKQKLKSFISSEDFKVEDFTINGFETDNDIQKLLGILSPNGSWSDIDYTDRSHARWMPAMHWKRLLKLSLMLTDNNCKYYGDTVLLNKALTAMEFWTIVIPVCPNYLWNAVGVPLYMGPACLGILSKEKYSRRG